jgi:hypothetical protein
MLLSDLSAFGLQEQMKKAKAEKGGILKMFKLTTSSELSSLVAGQIRC